MLRGACPQCAQPVPWRHRLGAAAFWRQWRCDRCGAWVEVRFWSQMTILYGLIPAVLVVLMMWRWPRARPALWGWKGWLPWAGLGMVGLWAWLTSRLGVVHESSSHCHACGYPLPPLSDLPPQTARVCPECGAKS